MYVRHPHTSNGQYAQYGGPGSFIMLTDPYTLTPPPSRHFEPPLSIEKSGG